jgi:surfeit locus 1 family protein
VVFGSLSQRRAVVIPVVSIVLVGMVYLLVSLAFWQLRRGAEKAGIKADYEARLGNQPLVLGSVELDPDLFEFHPVVARGEYVEADQILVDNRIRNGRPGYGVITPLRLSASSKYVLVDRGWIPWNLDRGDVPKPAVPAGEQQVTGMLKLPARDFYTLETTKPDATQRVWQNLDVDHYRQLKGMDLHELIILLSPDAPVGGFERELPAYTDQWIARHRGYAIQWFGLAAVLVIAVGIFALRARQGRSDD